MAVITGWKRAQVDRSLHIVIGMTIAYAASLLGLLVAWVAYRRRRKREDAERRHDDE